MNDPLITYQNPHHNIVLKCLTQHDGSVTPQTLDELLRVYAQTSYNAGVIGALSARASTIKASRFNPVAYFRNLFK